jgi:hypothetical protein
MAQATLVDLDGAHARAIVKPNYTVPDTTPAVIIQRTEDGGITWNDVRGDLADGVVSMRSGTSRQFPDYELPFDTPVQYRSIKSDLAGNPQGSTYNLSATVVMLSTPNPCLWWIHPIDVPTAIGGFMPEDDGGATFGANRGVSYGNNAKYPIVVVGARQARSGASFGLVARSNAEQADLLNAISGPSVLCVRSPSAHGWTRRYIVALAIKEAHPTPVQAGLWLYTVTYVEVARPTTVLEVYGATYDELSVAFPTYTALQAAFGTYDDQTLGIV